MSQQNKPEDFVKSFAANFAKNFAQTAPLQNGNFAQLRSAETLLHLPEFRAFLNLWFAKPRPIQEYYLVGGSWCTVGPLASALQEAPKLQCTLVYQINREEAPPGNDQPHHF